MKYEHQEESEDGLTREEWLFLTHREPTFPKAITFVLWYYETLARPSKLDKWERTSTWARVNGRDRSVPLANPWPVPSRVVDAASEAFRSAVVFVGREDSET